MNRLHASTLRSAVLTLALTISAGARAGLPGECTALPVDYDSPILVLGDDDAEIQVIGALTLAGFTNVVFGGPYYDWDGTNPAPDGFDTIFWLDGYEYGTGFSNHPEAAQPMIDFVLAGGTLVLTEWMLYDVSDCSDATEFPPGFCDLLPATSPSSGYDYGNTWHVVAPGDILARDVSPVIYNDGAYAEAIPHPDATIVFESLNGYPMLSYRDDLGGKVIHVNNDLTYTTGYVGPNVMQILINAAICGSGATSPDNDCNENGIIDECETDLLGSPDLNNNDVPDECEDCDGNGLPDSLDLDGGATDENQDGVLDACQDCNDNGVLDEYETGYDLACGGTLTGAPWAFSTPDLDWQESCDDCSTPQVDLPWSVTICGETYTSFEQNANGFVNLVRAGETPSGASYGSIGDLLVDYPDETYILAAYDDLDTYEFGEFGYEMLGDRIVFHWNTVTHAESTSELLNRFQIVLHEDGTIDWRFDDDPQYILFGYDLFTGLYLGHGVQELYELDRYVIPDHRAWRYDPAGVEPFSTDLNRNGLPDDCEDCNANGFPDELDLVGLPMWADYLIGFSSEYGSDSWSAAQTLGPPDTFGYGDISTAWTAEASAENGSLEYVTVGFDVPIHAAGVTVRETYGNGFVYQLDLVDTLDLYHTVWTGDDPSPTGVPYDLFVAFPTTPYLVKGVKVYVDTDSTDSYEEIDAIAVHGEPFSLDVDENGVPDECVDDDCNDNGVPDGIETASEFEAGQGDGAEDDCADARHVCPGIIYVGTTDDATPDGPLEDCAGYIAVFDEWYRYRPAWSGAADFTFFGSGMIVILEVWDGCPDEGGLRVECATGPDTDAVVAVEAGHEYRIRIAGVGIATGDYAFHVIGPECCLNAADCNRNGTPDDCECLADVNGDGIVSYVDLAIVTMNLGASGGPADVDGSGVVNEHDQEFVLAHLGQCPGDFNFADGVPVGARRHVPVADVLRPGPAPR